MNACCCESPSEFLDSLPTYGLCESYVEIMIMLSYEIRDYRTPLVP